jgi:N-acetylmuramic acid 6-phosphate etherase
MKSEIDMLVTESGASDVALETCDTETLLQQMNEGDKAVAYAVEKALPSIVVLTEAVYQKLENGGRLFYIGSGTSGRLGIVDASELPPTFGVSPEKVIGIIAGGASAVFKAVEFAEDDTAQGWRDLQAHLVTSQDIVIGISASGRTPYTLGALERAKEAKIATGCIVCNPQSPIAQVVDFPVEIIAGPEFIRGSSRLKAGTAQKMALNMISTVAMIRLGHVKGNVMVDMQLSNQKLIERGTRIIIEQTGLSYHEAKEKLIYWGSVRAALEKWNVKN